MRVFAFILSVFLTDVAMANVCPDPATLETSARQNPPAGFEFLHGCTLNGHVVFDRALIFGNKSGNVFCSYEILPLPPGMATCSFEYKSTNTVTPIMNTGWKNEKVLIDDMPENETTYCHSANYPTYNARDCQFN